MTLKHHARKLKRQLGLIGYKLKNLGKETYECPICGYIGPFMDLTPATGLRKHAQCPNCSALERHRLQFLVVEEVLRTLNPANLKMLHVAPEPFFRELFSKQFGQYESADIDRNDVDHRVDLQQLPFEDGSYDFVFASHVLEHIPDDEKAISEICRILKPNGIAMLPVPLVAEKTVEYPEPNPNEAYHVRAPGLDYFARYERYFPRVDTVCSDTLPEKYQLFLFEDRSQWPTQECPLRPAMPGEKHIDVVPVFYVSAT
jgi:SAM-dependent methyltransferase